MAIVKELSPVDRKAWNRWLKGRPVGVRAVAKQVNPWTLYRMKSSGNRVVVRSYEEHGDDPVTVKVLVCGAYNLVDFDREVFGVPPDDLEECDLPATDEPLGTLMNPQEVEENIDEIQLRVRPDLWMRMPDGSVVRKGAN